MRIKPESRSTCCICGYLWPHKYCQCPAKGQTCSKCSKYDSFAKSFFKKCNEWQGESNGSEPLPGQK